MSRSSIYINESAPGKVTMDFSRSVSGMASIGTMEGFAFRKTLTSLGLEHRVEATNQVFPSLFPRLHVGGSVETVIANVPRLQRHIGVIARYGAKLDKYYEPLKRDFIGRTLGVLVQRTLVSLPEDVTLPEICGLVAEPFAEYVSRDGANVIVGQKARWQMTEAEERAYIDSLRRRIIG